MASDMQFQRFHGKRFFNRLRLGAKAALELSYGTDSCLIDDISSTGARLRIRRPLAVDQAVLLVFHELRITAVVIWTRGNECGVGFTTPLDVEDMQGMLWITQNRELYERICREEQVGSDPEAVE